MTEVWRQCVDKVAVLLDEIVDGVVHGPVLHERFESLFQCLTHFLMRESKVYQL
jgi:hypothetical protein